MFSPRELSFFENLFNMESGYVLDFSRDGLKNFIRDSVNLDVFTVEYSNQVKKRYRTDSMANTLIFVEGGVCILLVLLLHGDVSI